MKFPNPSLLRETKIGFTVSELLEYIKKYEGLAFIEVEHFNTYFGYLPVRDKKLLFPIGTFSGWYNFNELRFALEEKAIIIKKVFKCFFSLGMRSPFEYYIDFLYKQKSEAKNDIDRLTTKLLLNNLYGKFGQRKKFQKIYFRFPPFQQIAELSRQGEFFEIQTFGNDREDLFLIKLNKKLEYSYTAIPSYASYITSEARITLLKYLLLKSKDFNVLYCDTDSIFYEGKIPEKIPISNKIGEFKTENKKITGIYAPKNYTVNGKRKIKGVPKYAKLIGYDKLGSEIWEFQRYVKTHSGLRKIKNRKTGENYIDIKIIKNNYDKRIVLKDGSTKPIRLSI